MIACKPLKMPLLREQTLFLIMPILQECQYYNNANIMIMQIIIAMPIIIIMPIVISCKYYNNANIIIMQIL